jgi:hypothetical protein
MHARTYELHGVRLEVATDDPRVAELLAPRLRRFAAAPGRLADLVFRYTAAAAPLPAGAGRGDGRLRTVYDAPEGDIVYDEAADLLHIVHPHRIRLVSDAAAGSVHACFAGLRAEDARLLSHPFFTIALLDQLKRRGLYGLHAALLARDGVALIVPGSSGAGKSTLALALLRGGFALGGDDLCFLRPAEAGLQVLAFPDEIDVTEATTRFFPELRRLPAGERAPGAPKWSLLPEDVYPTTFVSACRPGALVFPRIGSTPESRLEPMGAAEALLALMPNVLLTEPRASQAHLDAIGALVRASRCYRLTTGRDFDRLPALLARCLG